MKTLKLLFSSIKLKILMMLVLFGVVPTLLLFSVSYKLFLNVINQNTENNILEKNTRIKYQIEDFYAKRLGDISILSGTDFLTTAFEDFDKSANENISISNYLKNKTYGKFHESYHKYFLKYLITYGYYDILFVNTNGKVIYTVKKEFDFLSNLKNTNSSLSKEWTRSLTNRSLLVSDIERYKISDNLPSQFISMPVFKNNKMLGTIFFQISFEDIFQLLKENTNHSNYENFLLNSNKTIMIQSKYGFMDEPIKHSSTQIDLASNNFGYYQGPGYSNQKAFVAFSKIQIHSSFNWILVTEYPSSLLYLALFSIKKLFFIIMIAVLLSIVLLSFFLRKKIVDPLILEKERLDLYQMNIYSENLRTIGVMASGMAHELNNPLTIIEGSLNLLNKNINKPNLDISFVQNKLDMAAKACNRMSKIIRHMLDLSRDSYSENKLFMNLNDIINGSLYFYEEKFRSENIKVFLNLDSQLPETNLFPTKIETIVLNLLSNAFDSMLESNANNKINKEIHIKTFTENSRIHFELTDTGYGIKPDVIKNIFVPFFTTKAVGKGTGLGLSIAHEFIKLHNGQITVTSQINEGTTINFWVPIERS